MKTIFAMFESIKYIPYIIGVIDASHISIVALGRDALEYYCHKAVY